jgi:aminoglycoside phosphotransferase (APT) family kinase protein
MPATQRRQVERTLGEELDGTPRRRGDATHQPADPETTSERLQAFLADVIDEPFALSAVRRLTGGASAEQFTFELERGGETEKLVLRMDPPAQLLPGQRRREFQVIRAVADALPVPRALWVADADSPFGTSALITSFDRGVAAPTGVEGKATGLSTAYGEHRATLAPQYVEHLARLHTPDWSGADLSALDVPTEGTTEAVDRRIALWDRIWDEDAYEAHPTVALASAWLWEHRPVVDRVSLIHGDYRNGNFLFDEETDEITAILDWETAHLGDRHQDLAYMMLPGYGHRDDDGRYLCAGLETAETIIADYERLSGLTVDRDRLRYSTVLNMYWAIIACIGTAPRLAGERMTHNGPMLNFVPGLAAFFIAELTTILREEGSR